MNRAISLIAAVLAAFALPVAAQVPVQTNDSSVVDRAPPPPRHERMPGLRAGHVWVPGHWKWIGRDYHWVSGHYQASRPNDVYTPGAWVPAGNGWRWREGSTASGR